MRIDTMKIIVTLGIIGIGIAGMIAGASSVRADDVLVWSKTVPPTWSTMFQGIGSRKAVANGTDLFITGFDTVGDLNRQIRIEKRNASDGNLIWEKVNNPSNSFDEGIAIAADANAVYIAGFDKVPGNEEWFIEKRNSSDGSGVWSQSVNRNLNAGFFFGMERPMGMVVDATGLYVVGMDSFDWVMEKRSTVDGSLIWRKIYDPAGWSDSAYDIAVDATGVYISGTGDFNGNSKWVIQKRNKDTGDVVWEQQFDGGGGGEMATAIAIDSSGVYVGGRAGGCSANRARLEKRNLSDGSLVWYQMKGGSPFPCSGVGSEDHEITDVVVDSSGIYVADAAFNVSPRIQKRALTDGSLLWEDLTVTQRSLALDATGLYTTKFGIWMFFIASDWLVEKRASHSLTITMPAGHTVTVTTPSINRTCNASCVIPIADGIIATLTATPAGGSTFTGWSGACSGTGVCMVTMDPNQSVTASFGIPSSVLSLSKTGTGNGTVSSNPAGINCGGACSNTFTNNTVVTLTQNPAGNSRFAGWSGACSGLGNCSVAMNGSQSVTAQFDLDQWTLSVNNIGTGTGSVISNPGGINCGGVCSRQFNNNTTVTITATPNAGSNFVGWSGGDCSGITSTCTIIMDRDRSGVAQFARVPMCGNGIQEGAEQCDDGNIISGDNCSATCRFEGKIIETLPQ